MVPFSGEEPSSGIVIPTRDGRLRAVGGEGFEALGVIVTVAQVLPRSSRNIPDAPVRVVGRETLVADGVSLGIDGVGGIDEGATSPMVVGVVRGFRPSDGHRGDGGAERTEIVLMNRGAAGVDDVRQVLVGVILVRSGEEGAAVGFAEGVGVEESAEEGLMD